MVFLVCKLYKLGFFIITYFGHGQCFISEFLILAVTETARLNTTKVEKIFGENSSFHAK